MVKVIALLVVCLLVITTVGYITINNNDEQEVIYETNYVGLLQLGLAPSAVTRRSTIDDEDTGVRMSDGNNVYALIKSNTWATGDYGKTFPVIIE